MKDKKVTCHSVWQEYQRDLSFKNSLDLFEKTKQHHNFFLGRQWEGLNAPDLEKPVLNFVKRVVNYLISVLMVNNVGISLTKDGSEDVVLRCVKAEVERVNENTKFTSKLREIIKNMAIDGDSAIYVRYDADKKAADSEIVCNTDIVFGDRTCNEVERQPYIILVKNMARNVFEEQFPQVEERSGFNIGFEEDTVTVLIRLYRKNGTIHFVQTTENHMLTDETDTGQKRYPVAFVNWETVRNCCHGIGAVETIVPNQIAVNKLWAMALLYQKNNAFPKVFIDKTKLDKWNSSPGAVMGVIGNPNDVVATSFRPQDMASQLMAIVEKTIAYTKDFMGANDAALGNVSPNNTSAIVALQKTAVAPLELQKMALYQFVEDYVRIVFDIVTSHYGTRKVTLDGETVYVDFGRGGNDAKLEVDIGPSEYWSETAQIQTLDNLFTKGIISDALVYLDNVPDRVLPNKNKIIEEVKAAEAQKQAELVPQGVMEDEVV
ncbi:MAG: phage portal protein [Oscillospiraceae bacterium]|nr:phage portal protein [Oscillospiraceae bacterium]MBR5251473.1 phage portal protein [Oscillospiraceae bacterium]